jgi:hypothetical protein
MRASAPGVSAKGHRLPRLRPLPFAVLLSLSYRSFGSLRSHRSVVDRGGGRVFCRKLKAPRSYAVFDHRSSARSLQKFVGCHDDEPDLSAEARNTAATNNDMVEISIALRQISNALESSTVNQATDESGRGPCDVWTDQEYVYIDLAHAPAEDLAMDICVHRGRVFFRVEREGLGAALMDVLA